MPDPIVNPELLMNAIRINDKIQIDKCLEAVASWEDIPLSGIYFIKKGVEFYDRLLGVQCLASFCRSWGDMISTMALAQAAFEALENDDAAISGSRLDVNHMAANLLDVLVSGLSDIGNAHEVVEHADRWAEWTVRANRTDYYLPQIRLSQIEALLLSGDFDRARELLLLFNDPNMKPHASQLPILERLLSKMPVLLRPVDETAPAPINFDKIVNMTMDAMHRINQDEPSIRASTSEPKSGTGDRTAQVLFQQATQYGYVPVPADVDTIIQRAGQLEHSGNPNVALISIFDGFSLIFQNEEQGSSPSVLKAILHPLEQSIQYANKYGFWETRMSLSWLKAISLKRLERWKESATVLCELRDEIDRKRVCIGDPENRGGISVLLVHLYAVSAEVLYQLDESYNKEFFHVIETAKSKILGEITGAKKEIDKNTDGETLRNMEDRLLNELVYLLSESKSRVKYISFLVDTDFTYAAIVNSAGSISREKIPIGKSAIDRAARSLGDLCEGSTRNLAMCGPIDASNPWKRPFFSISQAMTPIIESLMSHRPDTDVFCVNPDGGLFNIPLHMIEQNGEPISSQIGISIVPSAEILINCANLKKMSGGIKSAFAFIVPYEDKTGKKISEFKELNEMAEWLKKRMDTIIVANKTADLEKLQKNTLKEKFVLFASHGIFKKENPLGGSGLYFANQGRLPGDSTKKSEHLATPKNLSQLSLDASFLVLLACVSGKTTEITSKEALGVIWSIFQGGASNILATAWKVHAGSSTDMLKFICNLQFFENIPIWKAHKEGMKQLREKNEILSHPYHWAPFVLYGYWE